MNLEQVSNGKEVAHFLSKESTNRDEFYKNDDGDFIVSYFDGHKSLFIEVEVDTKTQEEHVIDFMTETPEYDYYVVKGINTLVWNDGIDEKIIEVDSFTIEKIKTHVEIEFSDVDVD